MLKEYRKYLPEIVRTCRRVLGECEVYVFGSILDAYTGGSDIDVLICSRNLPKKLIDRARIIAEIESVLPVFHPFEFHLVTEEEFEFYKRHVEKLERIS